MRIDNDRRALADRAQVVLQPRQLRGAKAGFLAGFEIEDIDQGNKMHALQIEAVPAIALGALAIALEIGLAGAFIEDVVLTRHIADRKLAQQLSGGIELGRPRQVGDVAGMEDQRRHFGQGQNLVARLDQCLDRLRVGFLVKADVAVAQLGKQQRPGRLRLAVAIQRKGLRHTAGHGPDHAGPGPSRAFEQVPPRRGAHIVCTHVKSPVGLHMLETTGDEAGLFRDRPNKKIFLHSGNKRRRTLVITLKRPMILSVQPSDFERQMLPHLEAAFRLALWLTRDRTAAQDVVQDSYLRAFQAWGRFEAGNVRGWLFTIVRRQSYDWLKRERGHSFVELDEEAAALSYPETQESGLIESQSADRLRAAVMELPLAFREAIILKDIEDMPYKTIAAVLGVPMGTVMSRLARGRELLRERLRGQL